MGEIVEFPRRREACSRWRRGQAAISLTARPACAALAMALAGVAPALKAQPLHGGTAESILVPLPAVAPAAVR
ncbi:MAG: hypothetical protein QM690_14725 [Sphingobium sp.]